MKERILIYADTDSVRVLTPEERAKMKQKNWKMAIYDQIEYLHRHCDNMPFQESQERLADISREVRHYCDTYGEDAASEFAWEEYERPYIEMIISGIRVNALI